LIASVRSGAGPFSPAKKRTRIKAGPGIGLGSALTGGHTNFEGVGAPSFAAVLRSKARPSASEELLSVRFEEPLGKDHFSAGNLLGKTHSDAKQSFFARGNVACHFGVANEGEGRLMGKGKMQSRLWAWKGQLLSLKAEVDLTEFLVKP
jgi:hypothetical protein